MKTVGRPGEGTAATPLELARQAQDALQFNKALNVLRGLRSLSFQKVSDNVEKLGVGGLPRSTAHHMCTRSTLPARADQVERFVLGCQESAEQAGKWVAEWERLVCWEHEAREDRLRCDAPTRRFTRPTRPVVEVPVNASTDRPSWWRRVLVRVVTTALRDREWKETTG